MDEKVIISIIGFLGVIIGVIFQKSTTDKKNYLENITKERKEWRDKIRNLTVRLNGTNPNYNILKVEFQVRLNPYEDDEDKEIIKCFDELIQENKKSEPSEDKKRDILNEINERVAYLLKYDWERVKLEANKSIFFPYGALAVLILLASILILIFSIFICDIFNTLIQVGMNEPIITKSIKERVAQNQIFYILATSFIAILIPIICRLMICSGKVIFSDKIYKFFNIPKRRKYPDEKTNSPIVTFISKLIY